MAPVIYSCCKHCPTVCNPPNSHLAPCPKGCNR